MALFEDALGFFVPFLAFLFPAALYCAFLASVNRRSRPLLISGVGDAVALLFALSGVLLVVGPSVLSHLYRNALEELLFDEKIPAPNAFTSIWMLSWSVWLIYYFVVLAGCAGLIYVRRNKTVIYNIDQLSFEEVIAEVLDRLDFDVQRLGPRWRLVGPKPQALPLETNVLPFSTIGSLESRRSRAPAKAVLDVDCFAPLHHVTLHWLETSSELLRKEIEDELQRALAETQSPDNPAAGWFLGATSFLTALLVLTVAAGYLAPFVPWLRRL